MFVKQPKEYKVGITEIRQITDLVKSKYCFDFSQYAVSSFQRRIKRVLEIYHLENVDELLEKLTVESSFCDEFIEEITVNTTEMFRAPSMWKTLKETIVEKLKTKSDIKIWHAGCSSGEEVFSMAILLEEMGVRDKVTIYATDVNNKVIDTAKKGEYPARNMVLNEANYLRFGGNADFKKYYTESAGKATLNQDLLRNVRFQVHNLAQDKAFKKFDLVMCRNVMIYFDKVLQDEVYHLFHNSLHHHGYFVIGSKESMIWCSIKHRFKVVNEKERIYQVVA